MKRTIIYVLTPKRIQQDYLNGFQLPMFPLGWVKIGKTSSSDDNEDKWDAAYRRVNQEVHTGISEPCVLVDVFEYPYLQGNPDDVVRDLMTSDVYELHDSRFHNQSVQSPLYEIKAGREYIYGTSRRQILAAVAKFERNLLIEESDSKKLMDLILFIKRNNETSIEDAEENNTNSKSLPQLKIYDDIILELSHNHINAIHYDNKNYGLIKSMRKDVTVYSFSYSHRYNQASIAIETMGENNKLKIEDYIEEKQIRECVALSGPQQGVKNKEKYAWKLVEIYKDYNEETVKEWFVSNLTKIFDLFEK